MGKTIKSITELMAKEVTSLVENSREVGPEALRKYIDAHKFDIKRLPAEGDTVLSLQEIAIGSRENIVSITGLSKSRKTIAASAIASALFSQDGASHLGFTSTLGPKEPILHIDTEQGYKHYYNSVKRIFDNADLSEPPERFTSISTRDADIPLRFELLEYMIQDIKPKVLILDGVTDFIYDINSQEEAVKLVERLVHYGSEFGMLIVVVIHTTKGKGFMTGAIGTVLEKKSETVIKVELDEKDRMISHISCQYARNAPFHDFSIVADPEGKYSILNEQEVTTKGPGGLKAAAAYADEIHADVIRRLLGINNYVKGTDAIKKIQTFVHEVTKDRISQRQAKGFQEYYLIKCWLVDDAAGGLKPGYAQVKSLPPQAELPLSNYTDDLPF